MGLRDIVKGAVGGFIGSGGNPLGAVAGGVGGALSGGSGGGRGPNVAVTMEQLEEAQKALDEAYERAFEALMEGEAAAADAILEGVGLAVEAREKWFDVAKDSLQWVVDFGQQAIPDVGEWRDMAKWYMDRHKSLIQNPDSIFGTRAWQAHKAQIQDAVTNSAAAKSGLLSGNYAADLADYIDRNALAFRQSELELTRGGAQTALTGAGQALQQVGLGAGASGDIARYAFGTGEGISRAHLFGAGALGDLFSSTAAREAVLGAELGRETADVFVNRGNVGLAQSLEESRRRGQFQDSLFGLIGQGIETFGRKSTFNKPWVDPDKPWQTPGPVQIPMEVPDSALNPFPWATAQQMTNTAMNIPSLSDISRYASLIPRLV